MVVVALVAIVLGSSGVANPTAAAANPVQLDHPTLVPDTPELGYPVILDTPTNITFVGNCARNGCVERRQTFAVNLVGDYLVSGGDFQNIELQDGTVVSNPHLAVFDTTTRELVCRDISVNDEVLAIVPGPDPGSIIIGGRFSRIIGADGIDRARNRTAKIDLDTCTVDSDWNIGPVSSRVDKMAISGNRLFIGGSFAFVDGLPIAGLAEVNYTTAEVNPNFSFDFNDRSPIAAIGASPDGSRLGVVHRATSIDGTAIRGTAIIDISATTPRLTAHRMSSNTVAYANFDRITNGDVAPDFSSLVIAGGGRTAADYITKIPTGESPNQFEWQHSMRDSSFSVAVTGNAVYAGGHFCFIADGPGPTAVLSPNNGATQCTGSRAFDQGAWRSQIAALSLVDGTPLDWNPGSNSARGVGAMTAHPRGLLIGHDGSRVDSRGVGTTAFFDFGVPNEPPPPPPPPPGGQTCAASVAGNGNVTLTWTEIDGENTYVVRRNGSWLSTVGNQLSFTDTTAPAGANYVIRSTMGGTQTNTACSADGPPPPPPPPPGGQTCSLIQNGNGTVTLTWTAIDGENAYAVRRNGTWLRNESGLSTSANGSAADTFIIRSRMGGVITNTTCS